MTCAVRFRPWWRLTRRSNCNTMQPRPNALLPGGSDRLSLAVIYSYGGFTGTTTPLRSGGADETSLHIDRQGSLPSSKVEAFFRNPFVDLDAARTGSAHH